MISTTLKVSVDLEKRLWWIYSADDWDHPIAEGHFEDGGSLTVIDRAENVHNDLCYLLVEALLDGDI